MPLQPPNYFGLVDPTNPLGTDSRTISDDYHRMALASLQQQAANWTGAITVTHTEINALAGINTTAGNKVMTGVGAATVVLFYNATVPPGWTIKPLDGNLRNMTIAGSGDTGGTQAGSDDPSTLSESVNINVSISGTTSQTTIAHTHGSGTITVENTTTPAVGVTIGGVPVAAINHDHTLSGPTGDSGVQTAHTHTFSDTAADSDTVNWSPRYAVGILGTLDA